MSCIPIHLQDYYSDCEDYKDAKLEYSKFEYRDDCELEEEEPMSEENRWEEEFEKEYEADKGFWENLPNKKDIAKYFYLQARKVEKEERQTIVRLNKVMEAK